MSLRLVYRHVPVAGIPALLIKHMCTRLQVEHEKMTRFRKRIRKLLCIRNKEIRQRVS